MDLGQNLQNFTKSDIFTPDNIAKMMSSYLSHKGSLLEPCVGTGNLLKYIDVDKYDEIDIYEIKQEYLQKITNDTMLFKRLKLAVTACLKYKSLPPGLLLVWPKCRLCEYRLLMSMKSKPFKLKTPTAVKQHIRT